MDEKTVNWLVETAKKARERAYAPYSNFPVGAAVLTGSGKIYSGCNIEAASSGATCCAERTAIYKAVSEGDTDIKAVCCIADTETPVAPCGICRQVIREWGADIQVIMANLKGDTEVVKITDLLPLAFTSDDM
ncbi:MAG: cytidine deaminase [Firmicutes bacterium]|nr:cytidine deaminase [Bacillota bacterium]